MDATTNIKPVMPEYTDAMTLDQIADLLERRLLAFWAESCTGRNHQLKIEVGNGRLILHHGPTGPPHKDHQGGSLALPRHHRRNST